MELVSWLGNRIKISTGASGTDRRDLLLGQSSGYVTSNACGLLEELSEPEEAMTRRPKGRQRNRGAKGRSLNSC
jgi:hypothetical protein